MVVMENVIFKDGIVQNHRIDISEVDLLLLDSMLQREKLEPMDERRETHIAYWIYMVQLMLQDYGDNRVK